MLYHGSRVQSREFVLDFTRTELTVYLTETFLTYNKTSKKGTMDPEVRATVVTASHCTHAAELTSRHTLSSCYSCCVHSLVYAN